MAASNIYDVIIVGGGPAGLSAALVLGRSRRRVLVFDEGRPRNAASLALHGYLTRDGISPAEFHRIGREQLAKYDSVGFATALAVDVARTDTGFRVQSSDGQCVHARKLLLAAGVVDALPHIDGLRELYRSPVSSSVILHYSW